MDSPDDDSGPAAKGGSGRREGRGGRERRNGRQVARMDAGATRWYGAGAAGRRPHAGGGKPHFGSTPQRMPHPRPRIVLGLLKAADICSTVSRGTHLPPPPPPPPPPRRLDAARARPPVSAAKGHLADAEAARLSIRRRAIGYLGVAWLGEGSVVVRWQAQTGVREACGKLFKRENSCMRSPDSSADTLGS